MFEPQTIERLGQHWLILLAGLLADPDQPLSALPLLQAAERQRLLVEWNATRTDYPQAGCLPTLFEAQVEHTPEVLAVVFADEQLTYRALNRRANQLAHFLQARWV